VPMTVMVARVALVVSGALFAARGFGAGAETIFAIIATGNVVACVVLVALFRAVVR